MSKHHFFVKKKKKKQKKNCLLFYFVQCRFWTEKSVLAFDIKVNPKYSCFSHVIRLRNKFPARKTSQHLRMTIAEL